MRLKFLKNDTYSGTTRTVIACDKNQSGKHTLAHIVAGEGTLHGEANSTVTIQMIVPVVLVRVISTLYH